MAMKRPTLASFNFKRYSSDQDRPSKKEICFNPHYLTSLTCFVRLDKKNRTMHFQCFNSMKLLIKIGVQNSCTPLNFFCTLNFTYQELQKPQVKNFSGHTENGTQLKQKYFEGYNAMVFNTVEN